MKGQDHVFYELTSTPWLFFLAILIGLIILFFACATRVQADLPTSAPVGAAPNVHVTLPLEPNVHVTLPLEQTKTVKSRSQSIIFDYSDISNERTGSGKTSDMENTKIRTSKLPQGQERSESKQHY